MKPGRQHGATLAVGLVLLALITLLSLAGASAAHVERVLAQDEAFRENAVCAASGGIETAIRAIVTSPDPASVPALVSGSLPDTEARFEASIRFAGYELALSQPPAARLAGAHFEIVSTGYAARGAVNRQRAGIMWVVDAPAATTAPDCEPLAPDRCHERGALERLSWQRVSLE